MGIFWDNVWLACSIIRHWKGSGCLASLRRSFTLRMSFGRTNWIVEWNLEGSMRMHHIAILRICYRTCRCGPSPLALQAFCSNTTIARVIARDIQRHRLDMGRNNSTRYLDNNPIRRSVATYGKAMDKDKAATIMARLRCQATIITKRSKNNYFLHLAVADPLKLRYPYQITIQIQGHSSITIVRLSWRRISWWNIS